MEYTQDQIEEVVRQVLAKFPGKTRQFNRILNTFVGEAAIYHGLRHENLSVFIAELYNQILEIKVIDL